MKTIVTLLLLILFLESCSDNKEYNTIPFANSPEISNIFGEPKDSSTFYFPTELFIDNIKHDSFDYHRYKKSSYMLYKMKEPVLYNYDLGKETYRIIALRAFHLPIIVRIDKYSDNIIVHVKRFDRHITYPFYIYERNNFRFFSSLGTYSKRELDSIKLIENPKFDSLNKKCNNANYIYDLNYRLNLYTSQWDSLMTLVDSTKFWINRANVELNQLQIDGSKWIIEGQNKHGYKIMVIHSPRFDDPWNPHENDPKGCYSVLFRYVFKIAKLEKERLY
jgi:hypothetical protein